MTTKTITSITLLGLMLTLGGCGTTHVTAAIPKEKPNTLFIVADQEIGYSPYMVGISIEENYKYTFAIAATSTLDAGFSYFSIVDPEQLAKQYRDRNVTNISEAYTACMDGEGSFHTTASLSWIGEDEIPNCQNIVHMFKERDGLKTAQHRAIRYTIHMHNEDRKDHTTFSAEEALKSDLVKDLNKEYFKPIEYVE